MSFILASQSPYRRAQLESLKLKFEVCAPSFDEESAKSLGGSAQELSLKLAEQKALSLCPQFPQQVIVGSDQVLAFGPKTLGKPGSREENILRLLELQGQSHQLYTSVAIVGPGQEPFLHTDCTKLKMRPLSRQEIETYVDLDQAWDCAGGYKFESLGLSLFEKVETEDPSSIIGLPLIATLRGLRLWGIGPLQHSSPYSG